MCIIYLLVALAGVLVRCFTEPSRAGIILNPLSPSDMDVWFNFLMFSENYLKGSPLNLIWGACKHKTQNNSFSYVYIFITNPVNYSIFR